MTPEQLEALLAARREQISLEERDVSSRGNDDFSQNPREVLKDKKIKRYKDISRTECEETDLFCPSDPLREEYPKDRLVAQQEGVSSISPATISSRGLSGISAQHAKTKEGIKVYLTLQTPEDAENLTYLELTAELKRRDRLRELKRYDADDYEFGELYVGAILELKNMKLKESRHLCMGRVHARGIRQEWVANMFVVGALNENDILEKLIINYNGDEYEIVMDATMSPLQQKNYHCAGVFGELKKQRIAPRIETMRRKSFV